MSMINAPILTSQETSLARKSIQISQQRDNYNDINALKEILRTDGDFLYTIYSRTENNPIYVGQRPGVVIIAGNRRMHFYGDSTQVENAKTEMLVALNETRTSKLLPLIKIEDVNLEDLFGIEKETLNSLVSIAESNKDMPLERVIRKAIEG